MDSFDLGLSASAAIGQADQQMDQAKQQETFSIATPVVTNTSQIDDEACFLQSGSSYHSAGGQYLNYQSQYAHDGTSLGPAIAHDSKDNPDGTTEHSQLATDKETTPSEAKIDSIGSSGAVNATEITPNSNQKQALSQANMDQSSTGERPLQLDNSTGGLKKKKGIRKIAKLDTKSKLEKSRQSARECRARKKLRYQYLEDLVCNREKAVVKLREELSMFCEMSKRIDEGAISEKEKRLLIEQTRENSKNSR